MEDNINQNPEQRARDNIDNMLAQAGWLVQSKNAVNLAAGPGIAVKEYSTDSGPADYVLFVDRKPIGVIEAKKESEGIHLTQVEDQTKRYASGKLKYLNNEPLPFAYESTGAITRFTDYRDPKPRSRPVFSFHKPATLQDWLSKERNPVHGFRICRNWMNRACVRLRSELSKILKIHSRKTIQRH